MKNVVAGANPMDLKRGIEKAVDAVVEELKNISKKYDGDIYIYDSAAGSGCPVVASIKDADIVLLVVEPTKSSFSDLLEVLKVVNHFRKKYYVIVNKSGINSNIERKIRKKFGDKVLCNIPYNLKVVDYLNNSRPPLIFEREFKTLSQYIEQWL